jgi:hypothetical protein
VPVKITLGPYSKAITAVIGQAIAFATLYYGANHWVCAAVAVASALGVYAVPNATPPAAVQPPPQEGLGMLA